MTLNPRPGAVPKATPDNPANATALPVTINGHSAYGILIKAGIGYRTGCSGCNIKTGNGMANRRRATDHVHGDQPEELGRWVLLRLRQRRNVLQ